MHVTISERAKKILLLLAAGEALSRANIEKATSETRITTIRELNRLMQQGLVDTSGEARATVYSVTEHARSVILWDAEKYLAEDPDKRHARYTSLEPELLKTVKGMIGQTPSIIESAALNRRNVSDSITARKDLERFVIELSWKSSKIEGNTYTLLDTERLLREAEEAPGHPKSEAVMILNYKKTFAYVWEHQKSFRRLTHQQLV